MKTQFYGARNCELSLDCGQALDLSGAAGRLSVRSGRVWFTRQGELDDHVLEAGDQVVVGRRDLAVVEGLRADEEARLAWQPARQRPGILAVLWAGVGAWQARKAAAMAGQTRGMKPGDSMACAGTVK